MPLTGDNLVRLVDGSDVRLDALVEQQEQDGLDLRLFAVQDPQNAVAVAGSVQPGLIVAARAKLARLSRRAEPVVTLTLEYNPLALGLPKETHVVRCGQTQLVMLRDGSWRVALKLRPQEQLRAFATDIAPGTNGDLLPLPDGHNISSTSLKFPEVKVVSAILTGGTEDMFDLDVPKMFNYGLTARVFVHDAGP